MWSVLASLYPAPYSPERISHYKAYINELNFDGIEFPLKLDDQVTSKIEKQDKIYIIVLGYEKESKKFYRIYNNRNKPYNKTVGCSFLKMPKEGPIIVI